MARINISVASPAGDSAFKHKRADWRRLNFRFKEAGALIQQKYERKTDDKLVIKGLTVG